MIDEKALVRAVKRAMENAGTLPAKEAVKLVPADWHRICAFVLGSADESAKPKEAAAEPSARATVYMHDGRRCISLNEIDSRLSRLPPGEHNLFLAPEPPSAMLSAAGDKE